MVKLFQKIQLLLKDLLQAEMITFLEEDFIGIK